MCKPCKKTYNASYYKVTKDVHNPSRATRREQIRDEVTRFVIEYLHAHPCVDCGESDIVVLEFDHQRDKVTDVTKMMRQGRSLATVVSEIAKCEVVCANDHRRRTARTQKWARAESMRR